MTDAHPSPYAGRWYPAAPAELERLLDDAFSISRTRTGEFLYGGGVGYVVPHAGPVYSGAVAAAVYRTLAAQQPNRVVLIGFPHRGGLRGVAVSDAHAIATPLGEVALDRDWLGRLPFPERSESRLCDHSVEIQLPFLQRAVPSARIAPLYVGELSPAQRLDAASALAAAWTPGIVFVASSDFTHYGPDFRFQPFPVDDRTEHRIAALDTEAMDAAGSLDPDFFMETLARTGATVCGASPIALLLETLRQLPGGDGLWQSTLDYHTSGQITGDWQHTVSYAALGFFPSRSFLLDPSDCEALMDAAEASFNGLRTTGEWRAEPVSGGSEALRTRRGVFVSLHQEDRLLGCLGNCPSREPLAAAVPELAVAAALDDPRFRPAAEVKGDVEIEISVLTPSRRIRSEEQFQPGLHGATLQLRAHRGLLLPQVASERGWSARDFLGALSRKAGLGPQAWRDSKAELSVFEAQVFSRRSLAKYPCSEIR